MAFPPLLPDPQLLALAASWQHLWRLLSAWRLCAMVPVT
jgi:hypothetical protein